MLFAHLSIKYTDNRINPPDWGRLKTSGKYEFQQLPVLEIDGRSLVQTKSIMRYVCQRNGLYPAKNNIKDIYCVESVCDWLNDFIGPTIMMLFMQNMAGVTEHYNTKGPAFLQALEKRLSRNNGGRGFFVGASCTMADIMAFSVLWDYYCRPEVRAMHEAKLAHYPCLKAFPERMMAQSPGLRSYVQSRVSSPI
jgi:glutathione S-transferase